MEEPKYIDILLGAIFIIVGVGLCFVKVDKKSLAEKSRKHPGFALFRFKWYRIGFALVLFTVGYIFINNGFG